MQSHHRLKSIELPFSFDLVSPFADVEVNKMEFLQILE